MYQQIVCIANDLLIQLNEMKKAKGARSSVKSFKSTQASPKTAAKKSRVAKTNTQASAIDQICIVDETRVHPALKQYFGYCLKKVMYRFRAMQDEALKEWGIQSHHLGILKVVESETVSQNTLGEELGIDKASMVKVLDLLEELGYLERNSHPTDRRIKVVGLTRKGETLLKECNVRKSEIEKRFFKDLSQEEIKQLLSIMTKLLDTDHSI